LKGILFLAGGLLAVFLFIFIVKKFIATPQNILFFSVEKEAPIREIEEKLRELFIEKNIPLRLVHRDGELLLLSSCNEEKLKEILLKEPFFSLLVPCGIAVYQRADKTVIATLKEPLFIRYYTEKLTEAELKSLIEELHRVRITIGEVLR
jgi:hypothetical protein